MPLNIEVCGLLLASSVTVSVALCEPTLCGANVTEIVQLAFPANDFPQLFVSVKFVFDTPICEIATALEVLFVSVNGTAVPLLPEATDLN